MLRSFFALLQVQNGTCHFLQHISTTHQLPAREMSCALRFAEGYCNPRCVRNVRRVRADPKLRTQGSGGRTLQKRLRTYVRTQVPKGVRSFGGKFQWFSVKKLVKTGLKLRGFRVGVRTHPADVRTLSKTVRTSVVRSVRTESVRTLLGLRLGGNEETRMAS